MIKSPRAPLIFGALLIAASGFSPAMAQSPSSGAPASMSAPTAPAASAAPSAPAATTAAPAATGPTPPVASSPPTAPVAPAAAGSTASAAPAPLNPVAPPPAGKAQVVFYRPSNFAGMALTFTVHEGYKGLGRLPNGNYFVWVAEPGQHTYSVQSEATDTLTLEVEAGETYYVQQTIGMGFFMGRPHLTLTTGPAFDAHKLTVSTAKATDIPMPASAAAKTATP